MSAQVVTLVAALIAAQLLHRVRPRVRYSLPGVDLGLRNLARLPDWVAHHSGGPEGQELLERANSLATALHELVERSWRNGRPPSDSQRRRIEKLVEDLRRYATIGARQQAISEEPEE